MNMNIREVISCLKVSGYDKTPSELTAALESEGIEVHYEDNIGFIPKDVENTLVVSSPLLSLGMHSKILSTYSEDT